MNYREGHAPPYPSHNEGQPYPFLVLKSQHYRHFQTRTVPSDFPHVAKPIYHDSLNTVIRQNVDDRV